MSISKKDELEKIISTGVDFKNRRIYFGDIGNEDTDFNWTNVELVVRAIHKMCETSKNSKKAPAPIELHMSSDGGNTYDMMKLYDAIHTCTAQIKFYGSGYIQSSAVWIMASCDERYLHQNTVIMLHKGYGGINSDDNEVDMQISAGFNRNTTKKMCQMLADNSRMPADYWDMVLSRDLHLSAEEAIMLGLADKIIPYQKRGNLRRMRTALFNKEIDQDAMDELISRINKRVHLPSSMNVSLHIPKERADKNVVVGEFEEEDVNNQHSEEKESQTP